MTISELASFAEIISGCAVLISLAFAIYEIRRNTRTVRATSAWSADVSMAELNEGIAHNPQLAALVTRVSDPNTKPEDFSPEEFGQLFVLFRATMQKYQAQWFLWTEGHLSDEVWENRRRWAKAFVSLPVPGRMWERETEQHQYTDQFVESVNSIEASGDLHLRR
ncbi:MAG: hypothetical protein AAGG55_11240 [Pseudomonadota bacterium]